MSSNVISLDEVRHKHKARRGKLEPGLRLSINEKGELEIRETDSNGRHVQTWEANAERTKAIVTRLAADLRKLAIAAYYAANPPPPPKPPPKWTKCRLTPSGHTGGRRGCLRREGHTGKHRNKAGLEWT